MSVQTGNKVLYSWLPVVIWLEIIFLLSGIPAAELPQMPSADWLFWAHRTAHMTEYAGLGALTMRAWAYERTGVKLNSVLYLSAYMFLAGAFDEWHQSFVPGRSSELFDAVFDTICACLGMLVCKMLILRRPRHETPV